MNVNLYPIEIDGGKIIQIAATSENEAAEFCYGQLKDAGRLCVLELHDTGSSQIDFITPEALSLLGAN